jgi:hypothetical protein
MEPITIIAVGVGTLMIVTSVLAALGIIIAPAVSSPEEKYFYRDKYPETVERTINF